MSRFIWEISESADEAGSEIPGGTANLANVRVVSRIPSWDVKTADKSVTIVPQPSGQVETVKLVGRTETRAFGILSGRVVDFGAVVAILLFALAALGALLVVMVFVLHDMVVGTLTFAQFIQLMLSVLGGVMSFLAGLGVGKYKRARSTPER